MKKWIVLVFAAFMMVGCASQPNVSSYKKVVEQAMDHLSEGEINEARDMMTGRAKKDIDLLATQYESMDKGLEGIDKTKLEEFKQQILKVAFGALFDDYKVKDVKLKDNVAKVSVDIEGIDYTELSQTEFQTRLQSKAMDVLTADDLANASEEELISKVFALAPEVLEDYLDELSPMKSKYVFDVDLKTNKITDMVRSND